MDIRGAKRLLLGLAALLCLPAASEFRLPQLVPGGTAEVRAVTDGETLALADGRVVRLVGIDVPVPAVDGRRARGSLADAAQAALEAMVVGHRIELRYAGNPMDRHGRILAHLFVGGSWVQGDLLRRGLARVASTADNRAGVVEMLAIERRARRAGRGIWADPFYAVLRPEDASRHAGSFQLVEGEVVGASTVDGQVYLEFGADWRRSLGLRIGGEARRLWRAEGGDPRSLVGVRVRVRGWIIGGSRPVMQITYPEQIERLRRERSRP